MSATDPMKFVVGETQQKAEELLRDVGVVFTSVRVFENEEQAGDCAYRPQRLNLSVVEGLVTEAWLG